MNKPGMGAVAMGLVFILRSDQNEFSEDTFKKKSNHFFFFFFFEKMSHAIKHRDTDEIKALSGVMSVCTR